MTETIISDLSKEVDFLKHSCNSLIAKNVELFAAKHDDKSSIAMHYSELIRDNAELRSRIVKLEAEERRLKVILRHAVELINVAINNTI